eukprot:CAMPEP_0119051472 /NCGR_PEP_ID=MMETSP1177-20130426/73074_1 /TAXON_ID=2985 /ORGANISM="Ochromonas sp, Strain CCMP1899" /LENGTH=569 /DNA_ID=CAMNT_0007030679 /DNA_START=102 /DNA_END=1811 /DNA_ORIENTATION=-
MLYLLIVLFNFCLIQSWKGAVSPKGNSKTRLQMSDVDQNLLENMRRTLGDVDDTLGDAELETKQLMQGLRDLDRDPNMKANNRFMEWLAANGVWVKAESAWGKAPHPLVISSKTEDDGESSGRGLLARETMGEGDLMMTIPLDLCLTRAVSQEVFGKSIVPDYMDEYIAIAILLMSEKMKGSQSRWKEYFSVLPDAEEVYPSFVWTDSELESLKGSPTYSASKSLRGKLEREFQEVKDRIFSKNPDKFPPEKFTVELFLWAFIMLFSRAARLSLKVGGEELALVPYADLMNHNPYSNTYIDAQRSGMPLVSRTEEVAVYADRSYKKFEQVFINYGEKGNADLLLLYGFALDRNPFNAVDITVGLSKEDPLFKQKKGFLDSSGRGASSVRFPLQQNRYPSELVDFLRLLLVEPEDLGMQPLDTVDFNEPISPSLERRVLSTMISICESYLEQYPTRVEDDEALMMDRGLYGALTRQQRMAVKLRASEKRILELTIKAVQDELEKLPSLVTDERLVAAGRSFDAMGKKATVINAKSPADWVTLKEEKQKVAKGEEAPISIAERRRRRRGGN